MPRVPRISQDRVRQTPITRQGVGISTDLASFGGGQSKQQVAGATKELLSAASDLALQAKQRADTVQTEDAANKLTQAETNFLNESLNKRGKASFGIPEEFEDFYNKTNTEIRETLTNDVQRRAYDEFSFSTRTSMQRRLNSHVNGQTYAYQKQVTDATVANEQMAAISNFENPERVALSIERQKQAIKIFGEGPAIGMSEEAIKAKTFDAISSTHVGIVDSLITTDTKLAEQYYNENKSEINQINMSKDDLSRKITAYQKQNVKKLEESLNDKILDEVLRPEDVRAVSQPIENGGIGSKNAVRYMKTMKRIQDSDLKNIIKDSENSKLYVEMVDKLTDNDIDNFNMKQFLVDARANGLTKEESKQLKAVSTIFKDVEWRREHDFFEKSLDKINKILKKSGIKNNSTKRSLMNIINYGEGSGKEDTDGKGYEEATKQILRDAQINKNPALVGFKDGEIFQNESGAYFVPIEQPDGTFRFKPVKPSDVK